MPYVKYIRLSTSQSISFVSLVLFNIEWSLELEFDRLIIMAFSDLTLKTFMMVISLFTRQNMQHIVFDLYSDINLFYVPLMCMNTSTEDVGKLGYKYIILKCILTIIINY